ncbi:23S rRNA (adenine(1618)-N(6))-methyltransferase RlmF [Rheinheimera riviphila]|uniref:Ribosomal RNA large subunit methyltransferase F n=1 Tax=Rheinheimera riviphila TaxID=1834037 RepID=A0A437QME8_9GAMM|nr:23S rRNA (adenine(1618)-N(6))-methyltransferase RlmF [Rheinheimera riviphila]RVU35708.1 23S rRNA (adenine(1618)-N(6))-methyltransferase RlmF [Rheinheimera riviphila]
MKTPKGRSQHAASSAKATADQASSSNNSLHPANPHLAGYDMAALVLSYPALAALLVTTPRGDQSIDFADPIAVKTLNQALLAHHYQLPLWDLPEGYLCPPVPGRLDYLLYLADLLKNSHQGKAPKKSQLKLLDVGCGANLIYSLLAARHFGWQVLASDIDQGALQHGAKLLAQHQLGGRIELRQQASSLDIFDHLLNAGEYIDVTLCNPPFHSSAAEAAAGSLRKRENLGLASDAAELNFSGLSHELWCDGGELKFIQRMMQQSVAVGHQVYWFSSLVSKKEHLAPLQAMLKKLSVTGQQVVEMAQGNKQSRFIAWTFLTPAQQTLWRQHRW